MLRRKENQNQHPDLPSGAVLEKEGAKATVGKEKGTCGLAINSEAQHTL